MTDDAIVGWRYKYDGYKWTNQKHEPTFLRGRNDVALEPMYSAAEITRLRAERDASRATAQRALGAAAEANARLEDVRKAPLTPAEAMARCPEVHALADLLTEARSDLADCVNAEYLPDTCQQYPDIARRHHRDMDLCRRIDAALAAFTPLEPPPE